MPPNLEKFFVAFSYRSILQVPAESTFRAMTSARGEAQLEGSGLGSGGWWVVENGVVVQGSIVAESGTKRQKTGHSVDTNLGEVLIVWTFDCFFLLLSFLVFLIDGY